MEGVHTKSPETDITPLTPEQWAFADAFVMACELEDVADMPLTMLGQTGTVKFGLGRCAEHLMDRTPQEIADLVRGMLQQQHGEES